MDRKRPNSFWQTNDNPNFNDFLLPLSQSREASLTRDQNRFIQILPSQHSAGLLQRNRTVVCCYGNKVTRQPANENYNTFSSSTYSSNAEGVSVEDIVSTTELNSENETEVVDEDTNNFNTDIAHIKDQKTGELDITLSYEHFNNPNKQLLRALSEEKRKAKILDLPRMVVRLGASTWIPARQAVVHSQVVAKKAIKQARLNKLPLMGDLSCYDCKLIPVDPVSGQCGHTNCIKCFTSRGSCPCGMPKPHELHVNTLIKNIIEKMIEHYKSYDAVLLKTPLKKLQGASNDSNLPAKSGCTKNTEINPRYFTMTTEARFSMAKRLMASGHHFAASIHLAHVAAISGHHAQLARTLLNECIVVVSQVDRTPHYSRKLYQSVRKLSATSWLTKTDVECILCMDFFKDPVTTHCGHTYCRNCLLRSINYSQSCPLCKRSLAGVDVYDITETFFMNSILYSVQSDNGPVTLDPDVVPIVMCTVAFPSVPCPLLVFDARYWRTLRRLVGKERREFGIVARHKDNVIPVFGTMLEIRDCVQLQNGGAILTTVGKSRFVITNTDYVHKCDVARVERLSDKVPVDPLKLSYIKQLAWNIALKANIWLNDMDARSRYEIESVYGMMPAMGVDDTNWWDSHDGPEWLWWLISVLPLKSQIKTLILSAQCVVKRLNAVDVTINTIYEL